MNMGSVAHTAIDGGRVQFSAELDLSYNATSFVEIGFASVGACEIKTGVLAFGEAVAKELEIEGFPDELSYQGGTLRVGYALHPTDDPEQDYALFRLGLWNSSKYCLMAHLYNVPASDLVGVITSLNILETAEGLVVSPKDPEKNPILRVGSHGPNLVKKLPGLGILSVLERNEETESIVPKWGGLPIDGGELYAEGEGVFLLANDSAVTRVYTDVSGTNPGTVLESLETVSVQWAAQG
jgi:hypothetical protein